jgi:cellulose synthase/poly-beta-1,6-N-acetylglucosamine synthase-like glycosyltransferase
VVVRTERKRPIGDLVLLLASVGAASASVVAIHRYAGQLLAELVKVPLLGGAGSLIVIFFGVLPLALFALDLLRWRSRPSERVGVSYPSVAVVVPAKDEAGLIGDCVRAIDDAAALYPARCTVLVVENGSTDSTYEEAAVAIRRVRNVRGILLRCEAKGKAYALNEGLRHAEEEIVLRIDADTVVTGSVLFGLMRHFRDPAVGGASGMPLPRSQSAWICKMRAIEVYYQVAFKRAGYNAIDAVGVLPGALVAYRKELLVKLNGFAQGINGEDADMTIRVGRLGYRIVSDRSVVAYTEMPSTLAYLREQRMRWARGTYHMLARNFSGIVMLQGIRCVWMLPWSGFVMLRRIMIVPFAAAGFLLIFVHQSPVPLHEVAGAGAILLGVQLVQMLVCMTFLGDPLLIGWIPTYIVFRLLISFFALETLLGLSFVRTRPTLLQTEAHFAMDERAAPLVEAS